MHIKKTWYTSLISVQNIHREILIVELFVSYVDKF